MAKPFDRSQFLGVFKAEAQELIVKLNQGFMILEKDPEQAQALEELFRAAHTLKGSARMMGQEAIQQIAHRLEDLLGKVREGGLKITPSIVDAALAAVDGIEDAFGRIDQPGESEADVTAACEALDRCIGNKDPKPAIPPAVAIPPAPKTAVDGNSSPLSEYVRVPIARVDALLSIVGEIVINKVKSSFRAAVMRRVTRNAKTLQTRLAAVTELAFNRNAGDADVRAALISELHQCNVDADRMRRQIAELVEERITETESLNPVIDELQHRVKELRMLSCATIFEGFDRLVRDVARQENKEAELLIEGEETELDKKVLDALKPCLIHILRNAVSHGIESPEDRTRSGKPRTGTVFLKASHQGSRVRIEVRDDGRGINREQILQSAIKKNIVKSEEAASMSDREIVNLIFAPGFSTSPIITDISGRGVGLDVVRRGIQDLKGEVTVDAALGGGTRVLIELPLTVAIMNVLVLEAEGQKFGIAMTSVEEIANFAAKDAQTLDRHSAVQHRDRTVPIVDLAEVLKLVKKPQDENAVRGRADDRRPAVILSSLERRVAFFVDKIHGEEQIFIKTLGLHIGKVQNLSGATLLGSGEMILILDAAELMVSARLAHPAAQERTRGTAERRAPRILVVDDTMTTRELERGILVAQGFTVETAVDGLDALEKLQQGVFDLIVSDVQMPRMDGFEFCRTLRQDPDRKNIPLIFVTSLEKEEEKRKGVEVGAQAYIIKGAFDQSSLLQTIERIIG